MLDGNKDQGIKIGKGDINVRPDWGLRSTASSCGPPLGDLSKANLTMLLLHLITQDKGQIPQWNFQGHLQPGLFHSLGPFTPALHGYSSVLCLLQTALEAHISRLRPGLCHLPYLECPSPCQSPPVPFSSVARPSSFSGWLSLLPPSTSLFGWDWPVLTWAPEPASLCWRQDPLSMHWRSPRGGADTGGIPAQTLCQALCWVLSQK